MFLIGRTRAFLAFDITNSLKYFCWLTKNWHFKAHKARDKVGFWIVGAGSDYNFGDFEHV